MTPPSLPADPRLQHARAAALIAWKGIAHFWRSADLVVDKKADNSPATLADRTADALIVETLATHYPRNRFGYLTEEAEQDSGERLQRDAVWIIDPIDGTRDFIAGGKDFAIQIALVERGAAGKFRPTVAVLYLPAAGILYSAVAGEGAFAQHEPCAPHCQLWWQDGLPPEEAPTRFSAPERIRTTGRARLEELTAVVTSSRFSQRLQDVLRILPLKHYYQRGSMGVKMAEVCTGHADFYLNPERHRCKEWDLAAPQLVLEEAGGRVTDLYGNAYEFNEASPAKARGVLASNGACHEALLDALKDIASLELGDGPGER